jgi:uncharacterized membrane protein YbhN (UPF0104 family)
VPAWLKKTLQFSASLVAGLFILWLVFRDQDMASIKSTLASAKFEWIIASGVAALVAHGFRAARWAMLIEPLGTKPGFFLSFNAVMFGYLANLALPRMGEITRCGAIARKTKIPINGLIGTVIIERAIDMILLLLISALTVLFNLGLLEGPLERFSVKLAAAQWLGLPLWVYPVVLVPAGLFALYFYRKKLSHRLQHPFFIKMKGFVRGLLTGVFAFTSTSMLNPNEGLLILVAGSFGFVAPVQGGIGAYHAVISKLLVMLPGRGISTTDALSFATLTHAAQTILIMVVGFISVLILFGWKSKHGATPKHQR